MNTPGNEWVPPFRRPGRAADTGKTGAKAHRARLCLISLLAVTADPADYTCVTVGGEKNAREGKMDPYKRMGNLWYRARVASKNKDGLGGFWLCERFYSWLNRQKWWIERMKNAKTWAD